MAYGNLAIGGNGNYPQQQLYPTASGGSSGSYIDPTLLGTATNIIGSTGAANAAIAGNNAAIGTQQGTIGNINTLYSPQQNLGNGAFNTIGSTLGVNGQPADYSNFLNMPGYQFAVGAGTQAIDRQAEAAGNIYTPNVLANIGQYVTGTAMGDYNTYVSQLVQAGGFGAQANQGLTGANLQTGANISQLQSNIGQNRAGGYAGAAGAIGNFLNSPNGSGMVNSAGNYISNFLNGGGGGGGAGGGGASGGYSYDPSTGTYSNGFTPGTFGSSDYSPYVNAPSPNTSGVGDPSSYLNFDPNSPG